MKMDAALRNLGVTFVGGGVKVVEKWRFENPVVVSLERNSFGEV